MLLKNALRVFNLIEIKGVTESNLRVKYLKMAKDRHPDKAGTSELFVELREAYETLLEFINNPQVSNDLNQAVAELKTISIPLRAKEIHREVVIHTKSTIADIGINLKNNRSQIYNQYKEKLDDIKAKENTWQNQLKKIVNPFGIAGKTELEKKFLESELKHDLLSLDNNTYKEVIKHYATTLDRITSVENSDVK